MLYQAGSSPAGQGFAARHAECVFVSGPSAAVIGPRVASLRQALAAAGRPPDSVRIFSLATVVLGATTAEAQDKLADYRRYVDHEGALVLMATLPHLGIHALHHSSVTVTVTTPAVVLLPYRVAVPRCLT